MIVSSPQVAAALVNPLRSRILAEFAQPMSGASIARKLNLKRQVVNYHVRELATLGLIEFVEERQAGGMHEKVYESKARSFIISPRAVGPVSVQGESEGGTAKLATVAGDCISELSDRPEASPVFVQDFVIAFRDRDDRIACMQELTNFFAKMKSRYDHGGIGGEWRLIGAAYEKPRKNT
ncbi:MAG: helix-turn-helix domain-containing protein [Fimbriimonadaceae bacterium]